MRWSRLLGLLLLLTCLSLPVHAADYLVRVLTAPDGSVIVVHPSIGDRLPGESDAALLDRMMKRTLEVNPAWKRWPFVDVPLSSLPTTKRYAWRVQGGKVVVDSTVPAPADKQADRKAACAKIAASTLSDPLLKDLCATF